MDSNSSLRDNAALASSGNNNNFGIYRRMSEELTISVSAPREDMIKQAISFLTSPGVALHPMPEKEKFLIKRGLTREEIQTALDRVSTLNFSHPPPLLPHSQSVVPLSPFHKFREILHTVALLTGAAYGAYYFIKNVIMPFLFGKPKKPTGIDAAVLELKGAVRDSVGQLRAEVQKMQTDLERVVVVQSEQQAAVRNLSDIKSEVATVKGILLSRNQFPSVPLTGSASIPAWQMAACQDSGDRSSEVPNSNGSSQNSDSSLEVIKESEVAEVAGMNV